MLSRFSAIAALLLAVGCTNPPPSTTPTEELALASHDARTRLADLTARNVVVTPEKLTQVVGPLDDAAGRFVEELEEWGNGTYDRSYLTSQMPFVTAASNDLNAILGQLGISTDSGSPDSLENQPYWKRAACKTAVAAGAVGCVALCGPAAPLCATACGVTAAALMGECNMITCWAGAGSGSDCSGSCSGTSCSGS